MSRPVYEPSLPRMDAELAYGSRQLFRRPAPRAGVTEMAWAYKEWDLSGTPVVIPDSTQVGFSDFGDGTYAFTTDEDVFDCSFGPAGPVWPEEQGECPAVAFAEVVWNAADADFPGPRVVGVDVFAAYELPQNFADERSLAGYVGSAWHKCTAFFYLGGAESGGGGVTGYVYHEMGGDVTVLWGAVSIIRLSEQLPLDLCVT